MEAFGGGGGGGGGVHCEAPGRSSGMPDTRCAAQSVRKVEQHAGRHMQPHVMEMERVQAWERAERSAPSEAARAPSSRQGATSATWSRGSFQMT